MKSRKIILVAVTLWFLLVSLQINPTQAQEEVTTFGVEINQVYSDHPYQDTLDKAGNANNNWVRYNGLLWSKYQPNNSGEFFVDNALEANMIKTSEAGMQLILIIRSTPNWAQKYPGYFCGPMAEQYFDEFADFMVRVVEKYSQPPYNVKYYEMWNEQDECRFNENIYPTGEFGCWGESSDTTYFGGRYYGKMLKAVYPEVKAAVPEAQIVMGGLLLPCYPGTHVYCNMSNFLKGILFELAGEDGIVDENEAMFDYANFHGYTAYTRDFPSGILMETYESWWSNYGGMVEGKLWYIRQVMESYGLSRPVFLTEASLIDTNNIVNLDYPAQVAAYENAKADYLVYVYVRNIDVDITGTTWYHMDNYGWRKGGMLDINNEPLPAYDAYKVMTTTLGGASNNPVELSFEGGILGYEFTQGENRIWVMFSRNADVKILNKSSVPFDIQHVYNLFGSKVTQTSTTISFNRPIYIDNIPNTAPIFTSIPLTSVYQGQPYQYEVVTASTGEENFDVHTITSTSTLPDWLTLEDNGDGTASLYGTPNNEQANQSYRVNLTVSDSYGLTACQEFNIWVENVNDPPTFTSVSVKKAEPGIPYQYDITVTDPDLIHGDGLTLSAPIIPDWLDFVVTGETTAELFGTPDEAQVEERPSVVLRVVDQLGAETFQSFTIGELNTFLPLITQ